MKKIVLKKAFSNQDDNILNCFDYLQLAAVMVQLASKFFIESNMMRKADRRSYFVKGDMKNYQVRVKLYQRKLAEMRRLVANAIIEHYKVSEGIWNRSAEFYTSNPILAPQLHSSIAIFPYKHMLSRSDRYNELKKQEMYDNLIAIAEKKEDLIYSMFIQFKSGQIKAEEVPEFLDEQLTNMYDEIWSTNGIEEEEIFNDFYDHKIPFN